MRTLVCIAVFTCSVASAPFAQQPPPAVPPAETPPAISTTQRGQPPPTAQTPAPTPPQGQPPSGRSLGYANTWRNARIEITITDTVDTATKKNVSLLLRSGRPGQIRSSGLRGGLINVDAMTNELSDGRIELNLTLEYLPENKETSMPAAGKLTESLSVVLENGKPLLVTQSADPQSDRKVTVEVTATLLK
jgi:hypothetical protein